MKHFLITNERDGKLILFFQHVTKMYYLCSVEI